MLRGFAVLTVVVVAACNSGGDRRHATPTSTTTTVMRTTARQAASVVASHRPEIIRAIDADEKCTLAVGLECIYAEARVKRLQKVVEVATPLGRALEAKMPYEEEVDSLVQDTRRAIATLPIQELALVDCLNNNKGQIAPCEDRMTRLQEAVHEVERQLSAWEPYI